MRTVTLSIAEGARRVLADEKNCLDCRYYRVTGHCGLGEGKLSKLPSSLICDDFSTGKLNVRWTKQTEQDMKAYQNINFSGFDAEQALIDACDAEIQNAIDNGVKNQLLNPCGEIELKE